MSDTDTWYIVKQATGACVIVSAAELATPSVQPTHTPEEQWGPYVSREAAIARRVGLIRAGKCQPI